MADYDNKIPNTPQTSFQIGSVTKQFTATAILMLKEKGLLDIQDTIDKYIPDYPDGNKIKIYNLLNHTSGIPEHLKFVDREQWMEGKHTYTMKELIKLFKYKPFDFEPGTNFNYSNSNYILLGYIIEKVSGMSYEDYINNNIFKPLKMEQTGMLSWRDTAKEMASGYLKIESESATKSFIMEPTLESAAGEIYSTVEDLLKWNNNLCSGKLIDESSLKEMFTPYMNNYGYGWFVKKINEDNIVFHGGGVPGYTAHIARNIDKGYVAIILSNKQYDEYPQNIGELMLRIVSDK